MVRTNNEHARAGQRRHLLLALFQGLECPTGSCLVPAAQATGLSSQGLPRPAPQSLHPSTGRAQAQCQSRLARSRGRCGGALARGTGARQASHDGTAQQCHSQALLGVESRCLWINKRLAANSKGSATSRWANGNTIAYLASACHTAGCGSSPRAGSTTAPLATPAWPAPPLQ